MTIKFKLAISAIVVIAFSCKQPSAKEGVVQDINSKAYLNTGNVSAIPGRSDTLIAKQSKATAVKPYCCKGAPSRFRVKARAKKEN